MEKQYIGQIALNEKILPIFIHRKSDVIVEFYDENNNLIAFLSDRPYSLVLAYEYRNMPPEFLNQLQSLWNDIIEHNISLEAKNKELKKFSNALNIDKSRIIQISSININQTLKQSKQNKDKSNLKRQHSDMKLDENPLSRIQIKEETKLDTLVDDRHTLGHILGINESGASLICVHSSDIPGEHSNSEFSFLIKHSNGKVEKADMLVQEDGTTPNRTVYSSNRDGSSVDKVPVRALYRVKTPNGQNSMISVSFGSTGTLNFQYGKADMVNQNNFVAIPLETNTSRFVTKEVQDILDIEHGSYQVNKSYNEISSHYNNNCKDNLSLQNMDGDYSTGHQHINDELTNSSDYLTLTATKILEEYPNLEDEYGYSVEDLKKELKSFATRHPDADFNDPKCIKSIVYDLQMFPNMIL